TFAAQHFLPTEIVSSDVCRGMVADDENDQSATGPAFELLHFIVGKRLEAGRLTVIDATNVQPNARRELVALARGHDVLPVAVVLDVPERVCLDRNESRADRTFGAHVVRRQRDQLRRGFKGLQREGFRTVHRLGGLDEIADVSFTRTRLFNDLRDETGPFDVIGDIHGCRSELETLLEHLDYRIERDGQGRACDARHERRRAIFVGDLVDRGPDTPGVLRLVMGMVASGNAYCVSGNHEAKLLRALRGRNVQRTHGLAQTLSQMELETDEFRERVEQFVDRLTGHHVFDGGALVVSHAGLIEKYHGRASGRVREFCLYGQTTGETDEYGLPVRYPWAQEYRGSAIVLYGHTPVPTPEWINNTMCLDTGCVFGGRLTALRYPEKDIVSVPAEAVHYEPARPFPIPDSPVSTEVGRRDPDVLDLTDVAGKTVIETAYHGRISIREENAAAALEVMSRFAIDPRWLLYLPPTMSPVATAKDSEFLERPEQAFDYYRSEGVRQVICEEKHMGSRAALLVCRSAQVARERFSVTGDAIGAAWTRTGRSFFEEELNGQLITRLRDAAEEAGLFEQLDSSWLLLDAEILPWGAKAGQLIREQYAAVGAAARSALPAQIRVLRQAHEAGLDVAELLERTIEREANTAAYAQVYRRYNWSTQGLDGIGVAPFQLLAAQGATFSDRPHEWHLSLSDRLAEAAPDLITTTRRIEVGTDDAQSVQSGVRWWQELTDAGGEGMVVKPADNLTRGAKGLVQPGLKVRGREYLRIIYGPDYTLPANLERLRPRQLGHKRSMALREYALGQQGLDLVAADEPLWRVHQCVFGVLALESEPVDPRL
ncbi:MAG: polynucleotide kinase-phosphatase, partial [Allobranchiibius sp.]